MADFEKKLTDLESVVERLEQGDLPLEESVRLFEEGMKLSESCKQELDSAEGRIQVLMEQGGGKMKAQPLELEAEEDEDFDADEDVDED
ncbi:MAG: exodeoxyribonuclease VII small subunit [Edaphobacter sp.]|uniref:exodeoxyribonuclease VII small subunit n=1 Tax=Edaphobacter sp. TaxID=1934404 RepID=UPI00239CC3E4|nr:exodeoxyribonuclease VII small subunit [Edaphobacter sp.]MDE1177574.1 exodeoxyribonuclease VII small subunit [Edaphobacter sp.]